MEISLPSQATLDEIIHSHAPDSPTTSLIDSLRSQLSILSDQSTALNAKLIAAISSQADLEDAHLNLKQSHTELQERAASLEADKARWEESMNTGLLVERTQVKEEMQKLAAGLVEEERRRGSAEMGRRKVEEEVDELAASLFDQVSGCTQGPGHKPGQGFDSKRDLKLTIGKHDGSCRTDGPD